jgi:antitoxin component of MazEF toxin-antitoxin module
MSPGAARRPGAMTFTTTVRQAEGSSATGLVVPDEVVEALGAGRRPPVTVTVGGHTYRTTVARMGGRFMVPLSREHREAAGVAGGDEVEVRLEHDAAPRTVELPEDLAAALAAAGARERFDALAPSHRKEHVRAIEEAKRPETRARRIARCVEALG